MVLSAKANSECISAKGVEFYSAFYLPELHFTSAQVVCSGGCVHNLPMVPHFTNFLSLDLRGSTDLGAKRI